MSTSSNNKRELLNQLINLFWTTLFFLPILIYWIGHGLGLYFYLSIAASTIPLLLPQKAFDAITISQNKKAYEKCGVKLIRKFVQNGDIAKRSIQGRSVIVGASQAKAYLKTIAMYERFHWICFVFFTCTAAACFYQGDWRLGCLVSLANIIYNLSTILLQQYNKCRIKQLFHPTQ